MMDGGLPISPTGTSNDIDLTDFVIRNAVTAGDNDSIVSSATMNLNMAYAGAAVATREVLSGASSALTQYFF